MKSARQRASRRPDDAARGSRGGTPGPSRLSGLPSVDAVVAGPAGALLETYARPAVVAAVREVVEDLRLRLRRDADTVGEDETEALAVAKAAAARLQQQARPRLRAVVNATGVVLHTNLGRARLADAAVAAVVEAARRPLNLEYDLERGRRGERDRLVEEHLLALTGAEAATVVNNNAAAVVLTLHALARGREVVVSRGELVEIGGSFRIPDIMEASGALLREVGTTNRTHLDDYRRAVGPATGLLMKVHTSNYRIVGFSASVDLADLRSVVADRADVAVVEDLGAGALVDLEAFGTRSEPVVGERLRAGADLVLSSGDKLLGGPQCGIVVGRADLIEKLRRDPLRRALRCDKMTLAALEATLRLYRFSPRVESEVPTLRDLLRPVDELRPIADEAASLLRAALGPACEVEVVPSLAEAGSGSWPDAAIESLAVTVRDPARGPDRLAELFRRADPPVIGRIEDGVFLLDVRLIDDPRDLVPAGIAG